MKGSGQFGVFADVYYSARTREVAQEAEGVGDSMKPIRLRWGEGWIEFNRELV